MTLTAKTVLITGASQGLGRALARKLASEGAKLALLARSEDELKEACDECRQLGAEAEYYVCDVRELPQIKSAVKAVVERFGTVDILINNAGIWTDNELEEKDPERRRLALEVNTLGAINMAFEVLPLMRAQNKGHILNVISSSAAQDIPAGDNSGWCTYGATKWAMAGFSKDLANSLRATKIKVTQLLPGGFDSNIFENAGLADAHKQPWMMKTEDVADVAMFVLTRPDDVYMEKIIVTKQE